MIRSRIHNTQNDHSRACNCRCTHGQHSHTRNRASNQQNVIILFATACKPNKMVRSSWSVLFRTDLSLRRCAFPALGCAFWRPPVRRRSSGATSPGIPREDRVRRSWTSRFCLSPKGRGLLAGRHVRSRKLREEVSSLLLLALSMSWNRFHVLHPFCVVPIHRDTAMPHGRCGFP